MGKAKRLHRLAVQQGLVPSIAQLKTRLMQEVVRRATAKLFYGDYGQHLSKDINKDVAEAIGSVLPESCIASGTNQFTERDLIEHKAWFEMVGRMVLGVLAKCSEFGRVHSDLWKLKSRQGRKRTGHWILCAGCGKPLYVTPSRSSQRRCRPCWNGRNRLWNSELIIEKELRG